MRNGPILAWQTHIVFFKSDSNLSFSLIFRGGGVGGIWQFFNNQIFYASLMKDGAQ